MKLFVIAPYLPRTGGASSYLYPLLKHLDDVEIKVYVPSGCADAGSMAPVFNDLPNVEVRTGGDTDMKTWFDSFQPDALLCWEIDPYKSGCGGTRVVSVIHGEGAAHPPSDVIVCDTENLRTELIENYPDEASKAITINGAVELGESDFDLRKYYGIPEKWNVVGFVGRFVPEKNPEALVRASAGQDWTVLMVGIGPQEELLDALSMELGVDTIFTGEMDNVWSAYEAMDLLCIPSLTEEFAQVSMEAALAGVPMVMTPVRSNPEIFGKNVFWTSLQPKEMRKTIAQALEHRHARKVLAGNAKRMIQERCGVQRFVEEWRKVLFGNRGDVKNEHSISQLP